ncbi:MAG: PP2C family protein-serine/threonine phosphatase [Candidatus Rifleibacteriota bacterium]
MKATAEKRARIDADRLLRTIVVAFCLFLFPVFIIFASLTRLYEIRVDNLRRETMINLAHNLDLINNFSSNRSYFHQLFKRIFQLAQKSSEPEKILKLNFENIKKNYPDCFEFIVWDEKGRTNIELTDQKGFKFILAKLFEVLKETSDTIVDDMNVRIADLPVFGKNKSLVGKFMGRFFIADQLKFPYLNGTDAGAAQVDFALKRSDYWYQIGERVSFLVFFNNDILKGFDGLKKIVDARNSQARRTFFGFARGMDFDTSLLPKNLVSELTVALARYDNFDRSIIETDRSMVAVKSSGENLKIFAVQPKDSIEWSVYKQRNSSLVKIVSLFFLAYLILYFSVIQMKAFVSIRIRLTMVFLFASLIPLMVLAFIGYDFVESRAISLKNEFINSSIESLQSFDLRSELLKEECRASLVNACEQVNRDSADGLLTGNLIGQLKEAVASVRPSEAYLVSSGSLKIFDYFPGNKAPAHSNSYIVPMLAASLKFINGDPVQADNSDYFKALLSPNHSEVIRHAKRNSGRVLDLNTGNNLKVAFQYAFGNPGKTPYNYYLMMLWDKKNLASQYLDRYFPVLSASLTDTFVFIRSANGSSCWPTREKIPGAVQDFLERTQSMSHSLNQRILLNGKPHIAVGIKGRYLENIIMASVVPEEILNGQIARLRYAIIIAIVLNIILTIAISMFLSRQFIDPLRELESATVAIGSRDFRYRVPALDNDEIGYLGSIFNRVIEGLGDLEVARIVQESLFPGNSFIAGNYRIYGRSIVMTTLGGDYYDCFQIDQQRWALIIGDVAGHGVPAGLMMAMAKSGVLTSTVDQQLDPTKITSALHRIFFAIKNPNMKRMMTLQYYVLDHQAHCLSFANAGHCFPLVIDPTARMGTFIEHVATPLGIGAKPRYRNFDFKLEPGQAVILYTDGLAEAKNSAGEEFGYERMQQIIPGLFDPDPEVYYQRILTVYKNWAARADDDLTIIVCVRSSE